MNKDEINLNDFYRILIGDAPMIFMLEVLIRSIVVYLFLMVILRLLGKRMSGKLSNTEMAVMLMFGAIVSSSMQMPDRGILEGCFVLVLVLVLQRSVTLITLLKPRLENLTQGKMSTLVINGEMQMHALKHEDISATQLFILLRSKGVFHLGHIKRLYMETSGSFSLYKLKEAVPGLSVLPADDDEVSSVLGVVNDKRCCATCGKIYDFVRLPRACENCSDDQWKPAVL